MTSAEMSSEFDLMFENLTTGGNIQLDEYEKSICLTKAQEQLAMEIAQRGDNITMAKLGRIDSYNNITDSTKYETAKNIIVTNPDMIKMLGITVKGTSNSTTVDVATKIVNDEVIDIMLTDAYQYPPKRVVYVVVGELTEDGMSVEVFPPLNFTVTELLIRSYDKPGPIITAIIAPETIDSIAAINEPTLPSSYHRMILDYAVKYAIQTYIGIQEKEVGNDAS
jgi:hypothetical protein